MKQVNCIKVYVCRNTYLYFKQEEMTGETEGERRKNIKKNKLIKNKNWCDVI